MTRSMLHDKQIGGGLQLFTRIWIWTLLSTAVVVPMAAQLPFGQNTTLPGHVLGILQQATLLPHTPQMEQEPITICAILNLSDPAGSDAFGEDLNNPNSQLYHHTISVAEYTSRFGPAQQAYDQVLAYFQQIGFTLAVGSANRRTLTLRGTRAQAESALHVIIDDYQLGNRTFHAIASDPSVPAALAPLIGGIAGLSNLAQARPALVNTPETIATAYDGVLTPAGKTNHGESLPPGLDGKGQTIALIEYDSFDFSDVTSSLIAAGLPSSLTSHVGRYDINGGTSPSGCTPGPGCGESEVLLDIVAALGIAQGADVTVFDTDPGNDFFTTINSTINALEEFFPNGHTIVQTWLDCEAQISSSDAVNMESVLKGASYSGYTLFASTGDSGGTCTSGDGSTYPGGISYPSDAPHAIAVGGTTLTYNTDGTYSSESWWKNSGGFGVSAYLPRPGFQSFLSVGGRSVPDVSIEATPGIPVCQGTVCGSFFGTSLSAPLWGGIWAIASQANMDTIGFAWSPAGGSFYEFPKAFHAAKSMTGTGNDFYHVGLGSPDITHVIENTALPMQAFSITPASGPAAGGTKVTIEGTGFTGLQDLFGIGYGVLIGGAASSNLTVHSDKKVTVDTPPGFDPFAAVVVYSDYYNSTPVFFAYAPAVGGVNPSTGPLVGGTKVTVTGLALSDTDKFDFGGALATGVKCANSSRCTMITPAHKPGTVDVRVESSVGKSPLAYGDSFTFNGPSIKGFSPAAGPTTGGLVIGLTGYGFESGMKVKFDDADGDSVYCGDSTSCAVTSPKHKAGAVNLTVTVDGVTSSPSKDQFSFVVFPTITGISPSGGDGGSTVTLTGTGFSTVAGQTSFQFLVQSATGVVCTSATQCTAVVPPETSAQVVPVTVTVSGLTSLDSVGFSYPKPPPIPPCRGTTCN